MLVSLSEIAEGNLKATLDMRAWLPLRLVSGRDRRYFAKLVITAF